VRSQIIRRVLLATHGFYLDDSSDAALSSRAMMEALARGGFAVHVLCGSGFDLDCESEPTAWLAERGWTFQRHGREPSESDGSGPATPSHVRFMVRSVPVTLHQGTTTKLHEPGEAERGEFLRLFDEALSRFRPDVVVGYGGGRLAREVFSRARARGAVTVFLLQNLYDYDAGTFADVSAVLVPSRFAATYYRDALGLDCVTLPTLVDPDRVCAERSESKFVTLVDPTVENGVYAFARIADELGRRRPDIPLLVVEGRGTEATLAGCGLDLRAHGSVNLMPHPRDPRKFWGVTRICLLPCPGLEAQPQVAIEALANGIPVVSSDRGGIPETLGKSGIILPLPERLTPATRLLPSAEEVAPWVEAVIRLWDDAKLHAEYRRSAEEERRWAPEVLERRYIEFFRGLRHNSKLSVGSSHGRAKAVVLVPHNNGIERECEQGLRRLEAAGVRISHLEGCSAIDVARNVLASDALHDGFDSLLFIDSDIGFEAGDALRLLARPEPVVAGIYAKKSQRAVSSVFADGVSEVLLGRGVTGLYPLRYAATGFLRIKAAVLGKMVEELKLPLCNTKWGRGIWPFFQPLVVPQDDGGFHYLGEDWAFSHRLNQVGVTPLADTSIRLWHYGRYGYGWEDAGTDPARYPTFLYRAEEPRPAVNPHRPPA